MKARTDLRIPYLILDRAAREPLHRQIVRQIAAAIAAATLGAGVRVNGAAPLSGMPLAGMRGLIEVAHFPAIPA